MTEKTGFEPTQELPLSNKDIQTIIDCLYICINTMENQKSLVTPDIRMNLVDKSFELKVIMNKLNTNN